MMNEVIRGLGYLVFVLYAVTALWLLVSGAVQLHLLWHYRRRRKPAPVATLQHFPFVTIQVPVYNEKFVISRLLSALARLDYPRAAFEIQVLDDSTDETSAIIDREVARLQALGLQATVLRRGSRQGFKAGALEYGLAHCQGEFIAIFDSDFLPPSSFLKNLLPHFNAPRTGLVQARWVHLNRQENLLTRVQTFLLDTHFSVEQQGRHQAGYFINFCGTAGIWRKACIEDAGGWDGDVLSEDLDLSYRAQLRGWKLVYDGETTVPAEVPAAMEAFKIQQFRWTKGMAQTARKTLGRLWRAPLPLAKKLHGSFHLLGSLVFVCLLVNALLTLPLLLFRHLFPEFITLTHYGLVTSLNLVALTLIYYNGTRAAHQKGELSFSTHYPLFLVTYMALSVQNGIAVLQGLAGKASPFVRTPKGSNKSTYLKQKFSWINAVELALLCYFLFGIGLSFYLEDYFMLLFFCMMSYGLSFLLLHFISWPAAPGGRRLPAAG
jgi:cellulose synthase/poly-beta-1,6-N-acetylglucosamine synthase-like glycosyltransferase